MTGCEPAVDGGIHLRLEVRYPDCWTLNVTAGGSANLLAHTIVDAGEGEVRGHFTAFGESLADVEGLVERARAAVSTRSVVAMRCRCGHETDGLTAGRAARDLFVEHDAGGTISGALTAAGFIPAAPVRVFDGSEAWSVFLGDPDRDRLADRLDDLREATGAEITVRRILVDRGRRDGHRRRGLLSGRQREMFDLARSSGYYTWPRETTTRELADEAGVSKTTLLKHLRRAEAKLLDSDVDPEHV